jgi:hypothetical protein
VLKETFSEIAKTRHDLDPGVLRDQRVAFWALVPNVKDIVRTESSNDITTWQRYPPINTPYLEKINVFQSPGIATCDINTGAIPRNEPLAEADSPGMSGVKTTEND